MPTKHVIAIWPPYQGPTYLTVPTKQEKVRLAVSLHTLYHLRNLLPSTGQGVNAKRILSASLFYSTYNLLAFIPQGTSCFTATISIMFQSFLVMNFEPLYITFLYRHLL